MARYVVCQGYDYHFVTGTEPTPILVEVEAQSVEVRDEGTLVFRGGLHAHIVAAYREWISARRLPDEVP